MPIRFNGSDWGVVDGPAITWLRRSGLSEAEVLEAIDAKDQFFEALNSTSLSAMADLLSPTTPHGSGVPGLNNAWDELLEVIAWTEAHPDAKITRLAAIGFTSDQMATLIELKRKTPSWLLRGTALAPTGKYAILFMCEHYGRTPPETMMVTLLRVIPLQTVKAAV